jgi:hypothetical protein
MYLPSVNHFDSFLWHLRALLSAQLWSASHTLHTVSVWQAVSHMAQGSLFPGTHTFVWSPPLEYELDLETFP